MAEKMAEKIKVLEVLDTYYPKFDGPCLVVTSLAKSFIKSGKADVKVAVPRFPKYKDEQPFEVFRFSSMPSKEGYYCGLPKIDCKLKKFLKQNKFDIIHIHSPFTACKFFASYGKKHKIPTVFTFHTKYGEDFDRLIKLKSIRKFMMNYIMKNINNVDYVWTVSDGAAECLKSYGYKKDIKVIRNGTDLVYPSDTIKLIQSINEKYSLDAGQTVLLSVGRIVENKKLQLALNALKQVSDKGYDFKYIIVGSGNYENELKRLVSRLCLDDKVIFAGKIMDRTLLSAHYLRANLFVFPSTFDTASLSPIEAAAMKLPTIMTKGCSSAEIITDDVNGYLAEESIDAWAEKIIEILDAPDKLSLMKEKTYEQVYRTWDSVAEEILDNYNKILGESKNAL